MTKQQGLKVTITATTSVSPSPPPPPSHNSAVQKDNISSTLAETATTAAALDPTSIAMDESKDHAGDDALATTTTTSSLPTSEEDLVSSEQKSDAAVEEYKEDTVPAATLSSTPKNEKVSLGSPTNNTTNVISPLATTSNPTAASNNIKSPLSPTRPATSSNPSSSPKNNNNHVRSLDRAQEVAVSDLDEAKTPENYINSSSTTQTAPATAAIVADDDNDSSNDDSSYFADPSNLPSPKSGGRRYSWTSQNSAPHPGVHRHSASRESDASLSLSDSDDEDHHHHHHHSSDSGPYPAPRGTPDVYPQRIMRVHSVGSLISTSSQNSEDPIIHEELNQAAVAAGGRHFFPGEVPTGRLSPSQDVLNAFASPTPSSLAAQPSPPTIMSSYQQQYPSFPNYVHPRAGPPSASEDWIAAMASQQQQQQQGTVHTTGSGGWSEGTLNYSDDGEMHAFQQNMNGGGVSANAAAANNNNTNGPTQDRSSRNSQRQKSTGSRALSGGSKAMTSGRASSGNGDDSDDGEVNYQVYWQRWIMLLYMSVLNLLSDWTCYSVAPIALLTQQAFGNINPEELVVVFLGANAVATACEPIILSRLGLRRTVLFGALLLMVGSIVKSGGMPPIIEADLEKGKGEWRVYLGFFLVGLSQPLYQCTPALLSASWFPEKERTMATGVALNANQLGIGFAFIFGTLLVAKSDDIPGYFGLLSMISTVTFFGALFQFEDAPPTPPSQTARVVRGDLDIRLPSVQQVLQSIGLSSRSDLQRDVSAAMGDTRNHSSGRSSSAPGKTSSSSSRRSKSGQSSKYPKASAPSSAPWDERVASAPSPMLPGTVGGAPSGAPSSGNEEKEDGSDQGQQPPTSASFPYGQPPYYGAVPPPPPQIGQMGYPMYGMPYNPTMASQYSDNQPGSSQYGSTQQGMPYGQPYGGVPSGYPSQIGQEGGIPPPPPFGFPPPGYPPYPMPFFDPRSGQYVYPPPPPQYFPADQYGQGFPHSAPGYLVPYGVDPRNLGPSLDEGAEPVLTVTPHNLDIDIRDDQVLLSIRACAARPGFIHALVSFTVSGIVINTLSTFMDYLVRLNGAGREMTGIVGGTFQFVIMISSLIIGGMTDRSRAYYSVTVGMLVLGAFGLAECGVSLNADRGSDLRYALVIVALLVGPLQPVSTELGVEVVYPLSENTVLVIQQLFSNLLSALFIPCFKKMKDIGINQIDTSVQQPEYTFSFYLLIVLHAGATVFFATFNGRYLRYEHELQKKEEQERREEERAHRRTFSTGGGEKKPLVQAQHSLVYKNP